MRYLCEICEADVAEPGRCPECVTPPEPVPYDRKPRPGSHIVIRAWKLEPGSTRSWWLGLDRAAFWVTALAEQPRMSRQHKPPMTPRQME